MKAAILALCIAFLIQEVIHTLAEDLENSDQKYVEPEYLEKLYQTGQYEEFARLLQIDDVNLVRHTSGDRSEDPMFNKGLEGGDILLRPWQKEKARQGEIFANSDSSKWNKFVPYVIDKSGYTVKERMEIIKAILKWNKDIRVIRYRPRIPLLDKDYVMFFNGTGCYSNLGKVGGQQPISLRANGCLTQGTILHEMAHTVGIIHEHDRPDRDKYIKILPQNIPQEWLPQYEKSSYEDVRILGPYDYYSVMHYPIPAPHTHLPSFEVLKKNTDLSKIGQRVAQTDTDKQKIRKLYS